MRKGTWISLAAGILCGAGIYQITQLPLPTAWLNNEFRGAYGYDTSYGGSMHTYLSVEDRDFHVFNEEADLFLYGTYEKVGENEYHLKGEHIPEQTVTVEKRKFWLKLSPEGEGIPFVKQSNATMEVCHSLEKAKANDHLTEAQLHFLPNYDIFSGTYGYVDEEGNLSKTEPYRLAVVKEGEDFCLYNEASGYMTEGKVESVEAVDCITLNGEDLGRQTVYLQKNGILLDLDGQERLFVKLDDEVLLPNSDPNKKIS